MRLKLNNIGFSTDEPVPAVIIKNGSDDNLILKRVEIGAVNLRQWDLEENWTQIAVRLGFTRDSQSIIIKASYSDHVMAYVYTLKDDGTTHYDSYKFTGNLTYDRWTQQKFFSYVVFASPFNSYQVTEHKTYNCAYNGGYLRVQLNWYVLNIDFNGSSSNNDPVSVDYFVPSDNEVGSAISEVEDDIDNLNDRVDRIDSTFKNAYVSR